MIYMLVQYSCLPEDSKLTGVCHMGRGLKEVNGWWEMEGMETVEWIQGTVEAYNRINGVH